MTEHLYPMLRRIQGEWGLTHDQMALLLHVERSRYESWLAQTPDMSGPTIPPEAENAVPLVAVHRRLAEKLPDPEKQVKWLTTAHPDFDGHRPFDVATSSPENLAWLAYYLDSAFNLAKD